MAFFLVFLQHSIGDFLGGLDLPGRFGPACRPALELFHAGGIGVSFFFVLSGFLITYLILSEIQVNGRLDVPSFYVRRCLRIWPLYYLVLLFGLLGCPLLRRMVGYPPGPPAGHALYYASFLSNFAVIQLGRGGGALMTNITWSVAVEEQFYLFWPLLFFFTSPRFYKYLFPVIILLSALFRLLCVHDNMELYFHTLSVISDMAVGGLMAYLALTTRNYVRLFQGLPRWLIVLVYAAGLCMLMFRHDLFAVPVLRVLERFIFSLFFAFVILEQNYAERSLFKMSSLVRLSRLGKYTYGLYLLHPIALWGVSVILRPLEHRIGEAPRLVLIGLIGFVASLLLAYASYRWYEVRFLNLKRRFARV